MANIRDLWVKESEQPMAVGEAKTFTIDFTDIGTPTSPTVTCYNSAGTDVSATLLSGSASVTGDVVTLKKFTPATAGKYRLLCSVTISNNTVIGAIDVNVISLVPSSTGVTNGYTTRDKVIKMLRAETTDALDDDVIDSLINQASRVIDAITGRTFYARSETHYFSVPEDRILWMDDDLLSVTTLTNGDTTVITSTYYNLLPRNDTPYYAIEMKDTSSYSWETDSSSSSEYVISVVGTWGYSSTTPADIELACNLIVENAYRQRFGENITGATTITAAGVVINPEEIPAAVHGVLAAYKRRV